MIILTKWLAICPRSLKIGNLGYDVQLVAGNLIANGTLKVQMKASLCSVLNEFGHVIAWQIVPSDIRSHVETLLQQVWHVSGPRLFDAIPPDTCQDVWHVLHRLDQVMNKRHSDYFAAKKELSDIFGTVTGSKKSSQSLKSLLESWTQKYSSRGSFSTDDELIRSIGRSELQP